MKKALSLITLFLTTVSVLSAQQKVVFNIKYLPNTNYTVSSIMDMNMEMDFKGDTVQIKAMQNSGVKLPMVMLMTYDMMFGVKTGKANPKNEYPVYMTYDKMNIKAKVNGQETPIPNNPIIGSNIYGRYNSAGEMELDSIQGKVLDETTKQTIMTTVTDLQKQIKFPEKAIAVGETFTQDVPMNIPVGGKNMEMLVKATYKLIKIENGIAYLNVDQYIKMEMPVNGTTMSMAGGGDGVMEYSLKNKFISAYTSNFKFNYTMNVNNMIMEGKADMKSTYSVVVKP